MFILIVELYSIQSMLKRNMVLRNRLKGLEDYSCAQNVKIDRYIYLTDKQQKTITELNDRLLSINKKYIPIPEPEMVSLTEDPIELMEKGFTKWLSDNGYARWNMNNKTFWNRDNPENPTYIDIKDLYVLYSNSLKLKP